MRTISTSLLAALLIAALFWGNCFSCPQLLQATKHSCCHHQSNERAAACQTQVLRNFVKAEIQAPAPPAVVALIDLPVLLPLPEIWAPAPASSSHAPPDLLSLISSFRV